MICIECKCPLFSLSLLFSFYCPWTSFPSITRQDKPLGRWYGEVPREDPTCTHTLIKTPASCFHKCTCTVSVHKDTRPLLCNPAVPLPPSRRERLSFGPPQQEKQSHQSSYKAVFSIGHMPLDQSESCASQWSLSKTPQWEAHEKPPLAHFLQRPIESKV